MPGKEQRQELGGFLRARREALRPEDVRLPEGVNRRRTPGLRRDEVAQLAGISVSWYTRLEQGKDVQLSSKALGRVAKALQLTAAQREYVFTLSRGDTLGVEPARTETVSSTLQDVLDAQGDNPGYLIDARLNLLAWNHAAINVFGISDDLAAVPAEERNLLWLIFTDDSRYLLVDWERHAKLLLAQFRDASRHVVDDPWFGQFVGRLKERSPEFAEWWSRYDVERVQETEKVVDHPAVGHIALKQTVLQVVGDSRALYLILYTPSPGTAAAEKLQKLAIDSSGNR
ncbi:MAG TPA: helix-turn-helix transcriptional regulator [Actinomycetes bacterium]|nr:helix-turn-helix transcriptional regulator [Actinomycetes bacterium]